MLTKMMVFFSCLLMIFVKSSKTSLLHRSTIMLPMSTNHSKIIKKKVVILKFKLRKKEHIHFKLIRLLNDLLKLNFKIITNIPRR